MKKCIGYKTHWNVIYITLLFQAQILKKYNYNFILSC